MQAFFPVNIDNTHWTTVVLNVRKEQFQVLDSLYPLSSSRVLVENLVITQATIQCCSVYLHPFHKVYYYFQRLQIALDTQQCNEITDTSHPDVSNWPILKYDMPRQKDG
jgi:hypothetical protein